jgi:bacillopeptidase F
VLEALAASRDGTVAIVVHLTEQVDRSRYAVPPDAVLLKEDRIALRQDLYNRKTALAAASRANLEPFLQTQNARDIAFYWIFNGFAATVDAQALQAIAARPEVAQVFHDTPLRVITHNPGDAQPTPNILQVDAPPVWQGTCPPPAHNLPITGEGAVVGILDTGVFLQHDALEEHYRGFGGSHDWNWFDFVGQGPAQGQAPYDDFVGPPCCGHGTPVTGAVVSYNSAMQNWHYGVTPATKWIAVKVCDSAGVCPKVIAGLQWMIAPTRLNGTQPDPGKVPDIVNISLGWSGCSTVYRPAIQALRDAGILPVIAAGNNGPSSGSITYPGCYPEALTVGAVNQNDSIATFSSRGPGPWGVKPDVVAPGVSLVVPSAGGENASIQVGGTSLAAPHVAGLAALIVETGGAFGDPESIKTFIRLNAVPLGSPYPNNTYGWGRMDVYTTICDILTQLFDPGGESGEGGE